MHGTMNVKLVCKSWITDSEGAVKSSGITVASANLEFRTVRLTLMGRDSLAGKANRGSNHVGGEISVPV
jgi:hypothetical protein